MEEMETEPIIAQESGEDESNNSWTLDDIRRKVDEWLRKEQDLQKVDEWLRKEQDDIRRKERERLREQQQLQIDELTCEQREAFMELEKLTPDQKQEVLTQVFKETLPAAKHDLSIDEIRPLLYQNGVITSEEANELMGIFTGEEKITRLYTKMLPKKGMIGLKKFMDILFDTGWDTPSHLDHHAVLLRTLSAKLKQIKSAESVLHQYRNEEDAKEAIVPMVYSESLPDAVVNLSLTINKLLLPMFKEDLVSISEYFGLRQFFHGGIFYHEEKVEDLYMILSQKRMEGLKGFMKVLQDTGRRIPSHQEHLNLMTSKLQFTCLSKTVDKVKWIESVASDLHDHGVVDGTQDSGVPAVIYLESLPDAVVNLSRSVNKLLLPMLKKQVITTSEYYWLREQQSPEEKIAILYKVILPQKGVKGLQDYMELLQDTGKNIPRHQKHVNLMKSKL